MGKYRFKKKLLSTNMFLMTYNPWKLVSMNLNSWYFWFLYIHAIVGLFFENRYYIEGEGYFEQSISLIHVICL